MTDNTVGVLQQGNKGKCTETVHDEQPAQKNHNRINVCHKKLFKNSKAIKILKHLNGHNFKLVDNAVEILITSQFNWDSKVYQLFLHNILHYADSELVILCAASLEKQQVIHLAEDDRIGLISYVKNNLTNLHYPSLKILAKEYSMSSVNDE